MMSSQLRKKQTLVFLCILAASTVLRIVLSVFQKNAAIYADELFYTELAQNIWTSGVTVYETPLRFTKLLYPLLLSPFYLISNGPLRTAAISVFNALLLSSSLVPGWLLARRILKKDSQVFLSLLFLTLSANLFFSVTFMSENLYYPLLLWGFYAAYRFFADSKKPLHALFLGFLAFLLYFTKEVGAAYAAALIFLFLRDLLNTNERKPSARILCCFLCGLLVPFGLVRFILLSSAGFTYASQAGLDNLSDASHLMFLLWAAFIHLFYFLVSVLFVPVVLPLSRFRRYSAGKQQLLLLSVVYVVCVAFGISFGISLTEDYPAADLRIHLRYLLCAGFPFLLLSFTEPELPAVTDRKRQLFLASGVFSALLLLLTRLPGLASPVDSPVIQIILLLRDVPDLWTWVARVLFVGLIFLVLYAFLIRRGRRVVLPLALAFVLALEIAGTVFFTCKARFVEAISPELSARAETLADTVRNPEDSLLVVTDDPQAPLLKAFNTFSGRDYALVTVNDLKALRDSESTPVDGSLSLSESALPVNIDGFTLRETYSLSRVDTVLVLTGDSLLHPDAYTEVTLPESTSPARLYRAKDPSRLSLLGRYTCFLDDPILFYGEDPNCFQYNLTGFSHPEAGFTWTEGCEVSLTLQPLVPEPADLYITWNLVASNGLQSCTVLANETPVADMQLGYENNSFTFTVPAETYADTGLLTLSFYFPDAREPGNGDPRLLAAAFRSLVLEEMR